MTSAVRTERWSAEALLPLVSGCTSVSELDLEMLQLGKDCGIARAGLAYRGSESQDMQVNKAG